LSTGISPEIEGSAQRRTTSAGESKIRGDTVLALSLCSGRFSLYGPFAGDHIRKEIPWRGQKRLLPLRRSLSPSTTPPVLC
jgi:hypothetical protein